MPLIIDGAFYELAREYRLPDCSVSFVALAGSWSARNSRSGFVPATMLADFTSDPDLVTRTLCAAGILQRAKKGGWRFTEGKGVTVINAADVPAQQAAPAPAPVAAPVADEKVLRHRAANTRRQSLHRDPALKQAIRARDADRCRYCAIAVRWGKGRAPDSGTFDHVDPEGPNSLENLVVACCSCNGAKGRRTPEAAAMKLLDPPWPEPRNASCNASGDGSKGDTPIDDLDQDLNHPGHASGSSDPGDGKRDEPRGLVAAVIAQVQQERGLDLTGDQAEAAIAAMRRRVKRAGTRMRDPQRYIPAAIVNEPDLFGLLLPEAPPLADVLAEFAEVSPDDRHAYAHDPATGSCRECDMPKSNRARHREAS